MKFGLRSWLVNSDAPPAKATAPELIQPTEDEARNGWDAESLTAYVKEERERAQSDMISSRIFNRKPPRPRWANSRYDPLRWRMRA